ncbi:unnamed protein product [Lactuca saligna]|uniref:Uncharacterized protein n=1 Tax=Lactuca saligna TaxID=75948 RepID=A0AA36ER03_LACSI|nr:unnamed protein product [Lactuca saligna]
MCTANTVVDQFNITEDEVSMPNMKNVTYKATKGTSTNSQVGKKKSKSNTKVVEKVSSVKNIPEKSRKGGSKKVAKDATEKSDAGGFEKESISRTFQVVMNEPITTLFSSQSTQPEIQTNENEDKDRIVGFVELEFDPAKEDVDDNTIMSWKQYNILNSKLSTILQFLNDNVGKSTMSGEYATTRNFYLVKPINPIKC